MDKRASLLQWFAATAEAKLKAVQDYLRLDTSLLNCEMLAPLIITMTLDDYYLLQGTS